MPTLRLSVRLRPSLRCLRILVVAISLAAPLVGGLQLRAANPASCCNDCPACQKSTAGTTQRVGAWSLQNTDNFCICCAAEIDPAAIGRTCESLREELTRKWLGDAATKQSWAARCYVVVHPSTDSYFREVGAGGRHTLGSSLIRTDKRRVVSRRIDIRADVADPLRAALPHEMTHVVLADAFAGDELPRWADEGIAMLADPPEKLAGHSRDLSAAIAEHRAFRVGELFLKCDYPSGEQRAAFYSESASLVAFLASRRPPSQFVEFAHCAASDGYDAALRKVYGIQGVGQLESLWRSQSDLALR
jgi:hypothetical protein